MYDTYQVARNIGGLVVLKPQHQFDVITMCGCYYMSILPQK